MTKTSFQQEIGCQIQHIRKMLTGSDAAGFVELVNTKEPLEVTISLSMLRKYESGHASIPGPKLEKIKRIGKAAGI
ncbi:MAG: hypothetical protein P1P89_22255 [Desulfobacterales bacterium]|nr:hypothetical protein [Desulfobacterales bacterium]